MTAKDIHNHLSKLENDARLNVWHFALLTAILTLAARQKQSKTINVSRRKLMALSHIKTLPSYHKYLRELQELEIIKYIPSYHPGCKSEVELLV
ncbi:hypothetical protein V1389_10055 [Flavobacterium rakeshii]|uniref:hypothetical protein n=1 Tax=Flavobacterium rakeshii TaxID=1038845 RepID=UPI002E7BE894|nr:hypothetical protein [Flavobacterium rakeshii]MEE1898680.1 hypothetical protein [Flavobacterium rakeshii]